MESTNSSIADDNESINSDNYLSTQSNASNDDMASISTSGSFDSKGSKSGQSGRTKEDKRFLAQSELVRLAAGGSSKSIDKLIRKSLKKNIVISLDWVHPVKQMTALMSACSADKPKTVHYLIHNEHLSINVNATNSSNENAFHFCATNRTDACLKELNNAGTEPFQFSVDGLLPFHLAAQACNIVVTKWFIDHGGFAADTADRRKGRTIMHFAAEERNGLPLMKLIAKDHPKLLNSKDKTGQKPLHRACYFNNLLTVKYLLEENHHRGVKVSAKDKDLTGASPIHFAASGDSPKVIDYLFDKHSADPNSTNEEKQTPLHFAAHGGNRAATRHLIIHCHAKINPEDEFHRTPLNMALVVSELSTYDQWIVDFLVKHGGLVAGSWTTTFRKSLSATFVFFAFLAIFFQLISIDLVYDKIPWPETYNEFRSYVNFGSLYFLLDAEFLPVSLQYPWRNIGVNAIVGIFILLSFISVIRGKWFYLLELLGWPFSTVLFLPTIGILFGSFNCSWIEWWFAGEDLVLETAPEIMCFENTIHLGLMISSAVLLLPFIFWTARYMRVDGHPRKVRWDVKGTLFYWSLDDIRLLPHELHVFQRTITGKYRTHYIIIAIKIIIVAGSIFLIDSPLLFAIGGTVLTACFWFLTTFFPSYVNQKVNALASGLSACVVYVYFIGFIVTANADGDFDNPIPVAQAPVSFELFMAGFAVVFTAAIIFYAFRLRLVRVCCLGKRAKAYINAVEGPVGGTTASAKKTVLISVNEGDPDDPDITITDTTGGPPGDSLDATPQPKSMVDRRKQELADAMRI